MLTPIRTRELRTVDPEALSATASTTTRWRIVLLGRGGFSGWRRRTAVGACAVVRAGIGTAAVFHVAAGDRAIFNFPAGPGPAPVSQGVPFPEDAFVWYRPNEELHTRWPANRPWWNLTVPLARFAPAARAFFGAPLLPPQEAVRFYRFRPGTRERLVRAMEDAQAAPDGVPEAGLEDGLLRAMFRALDDADPSGPAAPARGARLAAADALVAVGDRAEGPVPLLDLCADLGVPLRTLNAASNAVLGLPAAAYLRRRRLTRAQADLARGAAAGVTEVAMHHGFWELGRFARDYRHLFGETPSATLRRATPRRSSA